MERAKELFLKYNGNRFYMDREGEGGEYESYHISKETEKMWAEEFVSSFLDSKTQGKEALRNYSAATELLNRDRRNADRDDVTILYMLSASFRMAEKATKKHCFSREERDAYLRELDAYAQVVRTRAEEGTLTRTADYIAQEFVDPAYVAGYLNGLKKKWNELFS